jgi:hypothetical protein
MIKLFSVLFLCSLLPLSGCTLSDRVDNRNFAVDTYSPTPNEIQLAQRRAQRYCQKNSKQFSQTTTYLAVPTMSIGQGEFGPDLDPKLSKSETTASFFSQSENAILNATCIMIYDTASDRFVSNSGYLSLELPPLGSVAHWENYLARYIGW